MTNIYTTAAAPAYKAAREAQRSAERAMIDARNAMDKAKRKADFISACFSDDFYYARTDLFKGRPCSITIYRSDSQSPSGVSAMASWGGVDDYAEAESYIKMAGHLLPDLRVY